MNQPIFQIKNEEVADNYGRFSIEPLEKGYGHTLGNALRRVLLSSLPGAAVTRVSVSGLKHQFGTIKGVKEDGVDLLLNIKKLRVEYDGEKPVKLTLSAKGAGEVLAKNIKCPTGVKIANLDLLIATLSDSKSKLDVQMEVQSGVGYKEAEDEEDTSVGQISIDSDFSPVKRVNLKVEEARVGRFTNYDKLTLEVWTDGTIEPEEALKKSAQILSLYLTQIISPSAKNKKTAGGNTQLLAAANLSVEELGIPTRIANALTNAGYETAGSLISVGKSEVSKVRNLGEKSVKIVEAALREKGISWE